MTIKEIIQQPEGKCLEFKEVLPKNANLTRTIIAFMNDAGGELYIGIQNNLREILGLLEDANNITKKRHRSEYVNEVLEFSFPINGTISSILFQQGIEEHVCDIIKEGNEAFNHRERKCFYYN